MEHLGLIISLWFVSLLVYISLRAKIKLRTSRESPVWPHCVRDSEMRLEWELQLPRLPDRGVAPPGAAAEGECAGWQPTAMPGEIQGGFMSVGLNAAGPTLRRERESALLPMKLGLSSSIQRCTFIHLPHGITVQQHVLWLYNAEWKDYPNQGALWVGGGTGYAFRWRYLRLGETARNTHILPANKMWVPDVPLCKSRRAVTRTDQRCLGSSSLYFHFLMLLPAAQKPYGDPLNKATKPQEIIPKSLHWNLTRRAKHRRNEALFQS